MTTRFRTTINGTPTDLNDLYVRKEIFAYGNLWAWGPNNGGLGDNTRTSRSSPVQTVAGSSNWRYVNSNGSFVNRTITTGIKTDGTLWVWSDSNNSGELGDNTRTNRSSPVQTVAGGTNWRQSSSGYKSTFAIKTDGTLWSWGNNFYGVLGDNTRTDRSSPVQTVAGGSNWRQVSGGYFFASAIKTDGTLWVWGDNDFGVIGDNTTTARSSPVQTVAGGTNWRYVSAGYIMTAIKTDGTLWTWGRNSYGTLGDNTTTARSSPVQTVAGGNDWRYVSTGRQVTAAIKNNGTLWTWGNNQYGDLGDNTTDFRPFPGQTISGGSNWRQVSCGYSHVLSIKTNGTLWVWGKNSYGELGDNTRTHRSSPVQTVAGGSNWRQVSCSMFSSFAIRDS